MKSCGRTDRQATHAHAEWNCAMRWTWQSPPSGGRNVADKDVGKNEPLTNAQKIRSMSDEELAEFLIDLADDGNLRIIEWLQRTSGEEDKHESN